MKKYQLFLLLFAITLGFTACSEDDSSEGPGTTQIAVKLTDAPGDFDQVIVEVEDVMIKTSVEGDDEEGWTSLEDVRTGPYDLLELTGGKTALLADAEIPAGYLGQIRLVLGDNNYLVEQGSEQELLLKVPSGQQSGLKLQVNKELEADRLYTFILDFDVEESIVTTGAGTYNLKPVIRVAVEEVSGSIVGSVHPTDQQATVTAQNGTTKATAYTDGEGDFQIHGLPAGTYKITVTPAEGSGLNVIERTDVVIEEGEVTDLETIYLDTAAE